MAEEDVLGDGQFRKEQQLLVDGGDARRWASRGVAKFTAWPLTADFAVVGLVDAGDDLDQGRFAGAVLAEQRMHLAGPHVERDILENLDAGEGLAMAPRSSMGKAAVDAAVGNAPAGPVSPIFATVFWSV